MEERVLDIVRYFAKAKKPIASLCHGPQVLITAGIMKQVKCTSYKAVKPDLIMAGADFQQVSNTVAVLDANAKM